MANELQQFRPAYLKLQEDLERLSRALKPSYVDFYEQMDRMFEPIRRQYLEVTRSMELTRLVSSQAAEIVQANNYWQRLIDPVSASTRAFEDMTRIHQTWLEMIKPMQESLAQLQAAERLSLGDVIYRLTVTEHLLARIDFKSLMRAVELPKTALPNLGIVIGDVTSTYKKLVDSIRSFSDMTHLPVFVLPESTRELFTTAYALEAIAIPPESDTERDASEGQLIAEAEQETSGCIALLQRIDPALVRLYMGAHDALRGRNTDRARHILSSLRELWNHLLRRLAPDEHVLAWLPRDNKELLHNGLPTRQARILYVCRRLHHEPLTDFVNQDTRAFVKLVEFFNRVHELKLELTDEQLRALLLRTDSWLTYLLRISEETK